MKCGVIIIVLSTLCMAAVAGGTAHDPMLYVPAAYATGEVREATLSLFKELRAAQDSPVVTTQEAIAARDRQQKLKESYATRHGTNSLQAVELAYRGWCLLDFVPDTNAVAELMAASVKLHAEVAKMGLEHEAKVAKLLRAEGIPPETVAVASADIALATGNDTTPVAMALLLKGVQCSQETVRKLAAMPRPPAASSRIADTYEAILKAHGHGAYLSRLVQSVLGP